MISFYLLANIFKYLPTQMFMMVFVVWGVFYVIHLPNDISTIIQTTNPYFNNGNINFFLEKYIKCHNS